MSKTSKQLERYYKGVANYHRIEILKLISKQPDITLNEIAEILKSNMKTTGEHTRRLVQAGLVNKTYRGHFVLHSVSPYGEIMLASFKDFE